MKKRGFTLTEVLFALAIIGVIVALAIPGLKRNIIMHKIDAYSKKAMNTYSSAVYEVMNSPTAPDSYLCDYGLQYLSSGTVDTGLIETEGDDAGVYSITTRDGMNWACANTTLLTVTFPDNLGECNMFTNTEGVITGGNCGGDLSPMWSGPAIINPGNQSGNTTGRPGYYENNGNDAVIMDP